MNTADFAAVAVALYAAHHVGDYWVQTHRQSMRKALPGRPGAWACAEHVATYLVTQAAFLLAVAVAFDVRVTGAGVALAVSGVTHYLADRREHGVMFWLVARMPWKADFLALGAPREPWGLEVLTPCWSCHGRGSGGDAADESTNGLCWDCRGGGTLPVMFSRADNPSLGTGAWALDQSWHIFWGVFVAAILAVSL